ncbi:unnamed protein product, partial [Ectocarpus sp. 8 AP-2014]
VLAVGLRQGGKELLLATVFSPLLPEPCHHIACRYFHLSARFSNMVHTLHDIIRQGNPPPPPTVHATRPLCLPTNGHKHTITKLSPPPFPYCCGSLHATGGESRGE